MGNDNFQVKVQVYQQPDGVHVKFDIPVTEITLSGNEAINIGNELTKCGRKVNKHG